MFKKSFLLFFVSLSLVASSTEQQAPKKQVRIYADIVGDLLHMGHVEFFKKAKAFGDYLIIGVLSDETVASYKRVPILNMKERAAVIAACKYVDEVIVDPPLRTSEEWLKEHKIDLVVHGDDFDPKLIKDQYGVPLRLGIFRSVPYTPGISTTNIIQRIKDRYFGVSNQGK